MNKILLIITLTFSIFIITACDKKEATQAVKIKIFPQKIEKVINFINKRNGLVYEVNQTV